MTHAELTQEISNRMNVEASQARKFLETFKDLVKDAALHGDKVKFWDFGTFSLDYRPYRKVKNEQRDSRGKFIGIVNDKDFVIADPRCRIKFISSGRVNRKLEAWKKEHD